jgi:hypothetical protein
MVDACGEYADAARASAQRLRRGHRASGAREGHYS